MNQNRKGCFCGSGVPYNECCSMRTVWVLEYDHAPGAFLAHDTIDPEGPSMLVFSSEEKADAFLKASNEEACKTPLAFRGVAAGLYPLMHVNEIPSVAVDLNNYTEAEGFVVYIDGIIRNSTVKAITIPDGFYPVTHGALISAPIDNEWFKNNPDLLYRVRPPFEGEAHPDHPKNFIVFVVNPALQMHYRFIVDLDTVVPGNIDWEAVALAVKEDIVADEQTIEFTDRLAHLFRRLLTSLKDWGLKNEDIT